MQFVQTRNLRLPMLRQKVARMAFRKEPINRFGLSGPRKWFYLAVTVALIFIGFAATSRLGSRNYAASIMTAPLAKARNAPRII